MRKLFLSAVIVAALAVIGFITVRHMEVARQVSRTLAEDPRNEAFELDARWNHYIDSSVLVLDLQRADEAAPLDLARGLFQVAEAMHKEDRTFDKVILARQGAPVFTIAGSDFETLGEQQTVGENPVYMVRKLPAMLRNPEDGRPAYDEWSGGLFGVVCEEMHDLRDATIAWAMGSQ